MLIAVMHNQIHFLFLNAKVYRAAIMYVGICIYNEYIEKSIIMRIIN